MKLSVGIPVYNASEYLETSIRSILNQSFSDFELIIIDDGSTDESLEIAKSFYDKRIKVYSDGRNMKLPYRLNQIISMAKGDFIARMDADDFCSRDRFKRQLITFESDNNVDVVFSRVCSVKNNNDINGVHGIPKKYPVKLVDTIKGQTGMIHASLMARRQWYLRNRYNESSILAEDYELYLRAIINNDFNIEVINDILYFYREEGNVTESKMLRAYQSQIEILKKIVHDDKRYKHNISIEIHKYKLKKIAVRLLSKLNKLHLLFKNRGGDLSESELEELRCEINYIISL
jgi:glycosyltransferase involved in cell wall biosynthesis